MKAMLSLKSKGMRRKLFVVYALMFFVPGMFFLYVIIELFRRSPMPSTPILSMMPTIAIGVVAALLMSIAAFLIMYRSIRPIRDVTRDAESFIREVKDERFHLIPTGDEGEKISCYITDMIAELKGKMTDVDRYAHELHEANRKLAELALKDGLTGLFNQSYIKERLSTELARARKFGRVLSILMLDIDDFKSYNDTYGHLLGDQALKETAQVITENMRSVDIPARYGGEEFLIILPEAGRSEASEIAEDIRRATEDHAFDTNMSGQAAHLTVSIGIAVYSDKTATLASIISAADTLLYRAKRSGKNKVCS